MRKINNIYIYYLKAIATFCVVCAHTYPIASKTGVNSIVSEFMSYLGTLGVPIFYIISGYLFSFNERSVKDFVKRKFSTIIIPWFSCFSLLYLYIVLRKGGANIASWFKFVMGNGSAAYYMTVLIVFYLVFWFVKNEKILYTIIFLSLISVLSTGWGLYPIAELNDICGNYYLNPLNWAGYFSAGLILSKKRFNCNELYGISKAWSLFAVLSIVYFVMMQKLGENIYYFSKYAVISNFINLTLIGLLAVRLLKRPNKVLVDIGVYSYTIYLTNMFVDGLVIAVTNKMGGLFILTILRPFVVMGLLLLMIFIVKKMNCKWINSILAIR